jgi:hypothetical protein
MGNPRSPCGLNGIVEELADERSVVLVFWCREVLTVSFKSYFFVVYCIL